MQGNRSRCVDINDVPLQQLAARDFAFVDLDSTALNKRKVPSAGFWDAVEAFEACGGQVIPATGNAREAAQVKLRSTDATWRGCPEDSGGSRLFSSGADLSRVPGIYQNGAEVRGCDGTEISATWLDRAVIERLLVWFQGLSAEERQKVGIAFQSYGHVYILAAPSEEVDIPQSWKGLRKDQHRVPKLEKWSRAAYHWGEGPAQALEYGQLKKTLLSSNVHCAMILTTVDAQPFWADKALSALGEAANRVTHCLGLSDASPLDRTAYVFTHPDASKGSALQMLLKHFGDIAGSRAVALGDNANDKPMFLVPGVLGIAVENAKDMLKEVAQAMTGSNEDMPVAGVARVLNRIVEARGQGGN
eukprot:TRINITY_DN73075_c0_g1_i1.p1 TRINITY_DN73075_c0_g1~~TRINITY_DN73075_c0_g1_i1.p1  ORF type:complete len:360 (-),score=68.69 TRINITY_DN73075_c0_g1_i1:70-1149(-)